MVDSLHGNRVLGHATGQIAALLGLASLALAHGERPRAARLGGCAQALLEADGLAPLPPDERALRALAAALGQDPAWLAGRGTALEHGLALALE